MPQMIYKLQWKLNTASSGPSLGFASLLREPEVRLPSVLGSQQESLEFTWHLSSQEGKKEPSTTSQTHA